MNTDAAPRGAAPGARHRSAPSYPTAKIVSASGGASGAANAKQRSAITNGTKLHAGRVNRRSAEYRRWHDLHDGLIDAVGAPISIQQGMLVRRAATLAVMAERAEARLVSSEAIDDDSYLRICGSLARILESLGLDTTRAENADAGPTLAAYLADRSETG